MTHLEKGEGALVLGGKTYRLKLGTLAIETMQETLGNADHVPGLDEIWKQVALGRVKYLRIVVWAMLQTHHPEIALNNMHLLLDESSVAESKAMLQELFGISTVPDPHDVAELKVKGDTENPPTARARKKGNGTGAGSTSKLARSA